MTAVNYFARCGVFVFACLLLVTSAPADDNETKPANSVQGKEAKAEQEAADKGDKDETENTGQDDLDKATALKVTARNFDDLGKVVKLCETALKKGLDEQNKLFAQQLIASTRLERATRVCREIFDRSPPNENWPRLARLALIDLELAVRQNDKMSQAHFLLGRIHSLPGGNRKRAVEALGKSIDQSGENLTLKSDALAVRGDLQEDDDRRIADYNEALKVLPDNVKALRARGLFHMTKNKHKEALADFKKALELEPKHAKTHEAVAIELFLTKKFDEAKSSLDKAIELAPEAASAYAHRARIFAIQGENKKALADIDKAIEMVAGNLAWRVLRVQIYQQSGENDKAIDELDKLLVINPNFIEAVRMKAGILAAAGRTDEAIALLEPQVQRHPDDIALLGGLAMLYQSAKRAKEAIDIYTKMIEKDVKNAPVYRARGDALLSVGKQADAIADYERALKIDPQDSGVLNNLAWVLATSPNEKLRDGKRSIELATKACKVTEYKEAHILSTLAASYAETGDFDTALEWSQKAYDMSDKVIKEQLGKELKSFKAKQPWRELQGAENEPEKKPDEDGK